VNESRSNCLRVHTLFNCRRRKFTPVDSFHLVASLAWFQVGWGAAFVLVGGVVAPLGAAAAGVKLGALSPQGQSLYILSLQTAETAVGFWVVNKAVNKFQPLPSDFLRIDPKGPLTAPNGWAVWAILGMPTAFATVALITGLCSLGGVDQVSGQGTTDGVIPMLDAADPTSVLSLIFVTAVLAPLVEEYLFRGFVLTSLTRYMPTPAAICLSAALFAGAHFAPKDAPQLFALGLVLGSSYVRTRNLLTPMLIHGMWNGGVLSLLLVLQSAGYVAPSTEAPGHQMLSQATA
jgi:membrane protease YdiL (CAAX protease family)